MWEYTGYVVVVVKVGKGVYLLLVQVLLYVFWFIFYTEMVLN